MQASVRLDHQLLAVEGEHHVTAMLELTPPDVGGGPPPLALALVLDRSGSMAGPKLAAALRCADWLSSRLRADDRLALVAFDDEVVPMAPLGPAGSPALRAALRRIGPGGSTNLSGGWLAGVEQLDAAGAGPRKVLLLTDGMANVGITNPATLTGLAARAAADGIATTTIGFGDDFDEDLLTAMADAGRGNAHWAAGPDDAPAIFAAEHDGLIRLAAQNLTVEIRPRERVEVVRVLNDHPAAAVNGGVRVQLGDASAGERRRLVFELGIPQLAELGPAAVADVVIRYVGVAPPVTRRTVTVPVVVNAVSAEEAAAVAGDPLVREEVLVLRAAAAREEAIRRADAGQAAAARAAMAGAAEELRMAAAALPADPGEAVLAEADALDRSLALDGDLSDPAARKRLRYGSHARRRGRRG